MATTTDLLGAWLHRGDPPVARRPALAWRTSTGWAELSYADVDRSSRRVAGWLASRGVGAGDRVAISGEAGADWVVALFGVWRRGAVAVPLDTRLGPDELGRVVKRARPSALIASGRRAGIASGRRAGIASGRQAGLASARPVLRFDQIAGLGARPDADIARADGDAALVVWTSGTSGSPKGVTLSLANIAYVVNEGVAAHDLDADDKWLSFLPLNHMLELSCGVLAAMATGANFAFVGSSAPRQVAAAMEERRCTRMTVVPAFLKAFLAHVEATGPAGSPRGQRLSLHCGGAPLDPAVARCFERLGIPVYTGYGLTETAPVVAMNTPAACRHGSVGRPLAGTEVRIDPTGEIVVRSPGVMVGYWDDAALTEAAIDGDGWLRTGDLGHLDTDGFLHVTGRTKTLIVLANAKKVQPEEVEEVLAGSALLAEACVVSWPGGGGEERVGVVVVAGPDLRRRCTSSRALATAAEAEVALLTAGLAAYKRPVVVRVINRALPRTAKGSVRRAAVLDLVAAPHRSGRVSGRQGATKPDQNV